MRFILASSTRYPTEKAYGVSYQNTAKTLSSLGHQVEIYSPSFQGLDESGTRVFQIAKNSYRFLKSQKWIARRLGKARSYFVELIFSLFTLKRVHVINEPVILWTRSVLLSLMASRLSNKSPNHIILEIHDANSRMNYLLKFARFNIRLTVVTPLGHQAMSLKNRLGKLNVIAVGNAASETYFNLRRNTSNHFKIGYLGKSTSSGFSNNILSLIGLAELIEEEKMGLEVELVGISESEIADLIAKEGKQTKPNNLRITGHIPHGQTYSHISSFNIGVVPYPESEYHNQRFPIKIVEYAAAGIPIIVCNSVYLDSVIPREFVYFSDPTAESILNSVKEILNSPFAAEQKTKLARAWAGGFTYRSRTKKILDFIGVSAV
jgi:glycosyltransferase involved in cell wall biosynthesis